MKKNKLESSFISFPNLPKKSPNIISLGSGDKALCMTFQPHDILSANSVMQAIDLTEVCTEAIVNLTLDYIADNSICSGGINSFGGIRIKNDAGITIYNRFGDIDGEYNTHGIYLSSRYIDRHNLRITSTGRISASTEVKDGIYIPTLQVDTLIGASAGGSELPIETLNVCGFRKEIYVDKNKYYTTCGEANNLTVHLPFLEQHASDTVKNIGLSLKIGTLPISFNAYVDACHHNCVRYPSEQSLQNNHIYEFSAHWNGSEWIVLHTDLGD